MKEVVINKMTLSDLEEISNNLISDFDDFWNSNILETEIKNPFSEYIVAKLKTEIVGFGRCYRYSRTIRNYQYCCKEEF